MVADARARRGLARIVALDEDGRCELRLIDECGLPLPIRWVLQPARLDGARLAAKPRIIRDIRRVTAAPAVRGRVKPASCAPGAQVGHGSSSLGEPQIPIECRARDPALCRQGSRSALITAL